MTYKATISSKGQVTIPIEARRKLKLGSRVNFVIREDELILRRQPTAQDIHAALGVDKQKLKSASRTTEKSAWRKAAAKKDLRKRGY